MCVRHVESQVTVHLKHGRSRSAAVRGLFLVFHRGILTYRSADTVQTRGVCFS